MSLAPNIRVNGIAPGPTLKNKRQSEKHFKKQYMATPLKRQVDVEQICNAVDFFIKNRSITGQVISVDSGQSLNWQTPDIMGGKEGKKYLYFYHYYFVYLFTVLLMEVKDLFLLSYLQVQKLEVTMK